MKFDVTVQDGVKAGSKTGVKLACTHDFPPAFTSDAHPVSAAGQSIRQQDAVLLHTV